MSEYPGILRVSVDYLREALVNTAAYLFFFLLITIFTVFPFALTRFGPFAILGYVGLATYFAHLELGGKTQAVDERDEPRSVKAIITLLLVIYYNVLIFVSVVVSLLVMQAGAPNLAFAAALAVPFIDIELDRANLPSFAALVSLLIWALGHLAEYASLIRPDDAEDLYDAIRQQATILSASVRRYHDAKSSFF